MQIKVGYGSIMEAGDHYCLLDYLNRSTLMNGLVAVYDFLVYAVDFLSPGISARRTIVATQFVQG